MAKSPSFPITRNQIDSHQAVPNVCINFYPFEVSETRYSNKSISKEKSLAASKITVTSDVISCQIASNKSNYLMTAELTLAAGQLDYQSVLTPGDYALIWLFDNFDDYTVISNLALSNSSSNNGRSANDSDSGLKFIGKVNSVRTNVSVSENGTKSVRYTVTLKGFSEFQSQIYYNPILYDSDASKQSTGDQKHIDGMKFFNKLTDRYNALLTSDEPVYNITKILNFLISVLIGEGPDSNNRGDLTVQQTPVKSYGVPKLMSDILGVTSSNKSEINYSDLLYTIIGIQEYQADASKGLKAFVPLAEAQNKKNQLYCQKTITDSKNKRSLEISRLYGNLLSLPDGFNNSTVWDILKSHSNPSMNELYCTLRVNKKGNIMPTFIARQMPFTTKFAIDEMKNDPYKFHFTEYTSLPRWVINTTMVRSYNIGSSDAARVNFSQVYAAASNSKSDPQRALHQQINNGNFRMDDADIYRHGPRTAIINMNLNIEEISTNSAASKAFSGLVTDFYMNGHLKANGSIICNGIQAPITIGDNLEIDNKIFHIESVIHSYQVDEFSGKKSFITTIHLSNGMKTNGDYIVGSGAKLRANAGSEELYPGFTDEEVYINQKEIKSQSSSVKKEFNKTKIENFIKSKKK